ncbi:alpha/beta fold hydrolase [Streptomyces sp. rh34]|uniref:alpha/beta fold hydrolase n=1 Tax=Streptomyces sp. rh34 TaxID=2034272 RepID=UPI000BF1873E|nr:alpha/beta fold hydrolase [Streptomyces sp. rh34]
MSVTGTALVPDEGAAATSAGTGDRDPVAVRRRSPGSPWQGRMLLLHGLANSASLWDACIEHGLEASGAEVWTAELPWRGDSVFELSAQGDVVPYMADALRAVPGGAGVVVAHSMGANVLLEFLNRRLEKGVDPFTEFGIRGLVLVSPFYRRSVEDFDWQSVASSVDGFVRIMTEGIRVHSAGRLPEDIQRSLGERVRDRVGAYGWMRFFETYLGTPRLRTGLFTVPCLVIAGEHDFAAPPEEGRALAADLPAGDFRLLEDCGHFLMIEQARRFAGLVVQFVSSSSAAGPHGGPGPRPPWEHDR